MSKSAADEKLKLIYFNGRGRVEGIRYLLAIAGKDYEDKRLELGGKEWESMKAGMPFRQLPVLEVNGQQIAESVSVGRYVAKVAGLYGSTYIEQGLIDSLVDKVTEFREGVATCFFMTGSDEEKAKALETYLQDKAAPILKDLVRYLGDGDFFVGNKLSFADVWFYHCMELLIVTGKKTNYLDEQPKLKALYKRVEEVEQIAKHIKQRPVTSF